MPHLPSAVTLVGNDVQTLQALKGTLTSIHHLQLQACFAILFSPCRPAPPIRV